MNRKRVTSSPFILATAGLLASMLAGVLIYFFITQRPEISYRISWWWKLSGLAFVVASLLVHELIFSPQKPEKVPRSWSELAEHVALGKHIAWTFTFSAPAVAVAALLAKIPLFTVTIYLPAFIILCIGACLWGAGVEISPTFEKSAYKHGVALIAVSLPAIIFSLVIPSDEVGFAFGFTLNGPVAIAYIFYAIKRSIEKDQEDMKMTGD
ncbi:hypothetical protein [Desulfofundulus thermocisternus]|uniref:hypothetical protein n=1 Tax=Desulfofundulus thermocisternus TaxID=42471 RepID=UPI00217F08AC|nr:hypothetical protein [Desulfofundulus thermocisternus]MCS5694688.1 hypothetical protein [Desulfofundulus thermocisternus]